MFETLVVSGGSTKGILFLGALHYVRLRYGLESITHFYGTSVGSMICLLLVVGYEPLDLVRCFQQMNFNFDLLWTKEDLQFFNYDSIMKCVEQIFLARAGRVLTFQELYEAYGKELSFVAYNYTQGRVDILSRATRPHMSCLEAIRLSCAIPVLFKKCWYDGDIYVDGGIVNNFPLDLAVEAGCARILGLNFDQDLRRPPDEGLFAMMNQLFFIPITMKARENIERYGKGSDILNMVNATPIYKVKMSEADILSMLVEGYCYCKSYFSVSKQDSEPQALAKEQRPAPPQAALPHDAVAGDGSGDGKLTG
jgi:predicted acylesterase/phospholipase RssA